MNFDLKCMMWQRPQSGGSQRPKVLGVFSSGIELRMLTQEKGQLRLRAESLVLLREHRKTDLSKLQRVWWHCSLLSRKVFTLVLWGRVLFIIIYVSNVPKEIINIKSVLNCFKLSKKCMPDMYICSIGTYVKFGGDRLMEQYNHWPFMIIFLITPRDYDSIGVSWGLRILFRDLSLFGVLGMEGKWQSLMQIR